jgi:hypothetical protein
MNSEEFKKIYKEEDEAPNFPMVDSNKDVEGKYVYFQHIYRVDEQFFCVETTESNAGYWGDGETLGQEFYEVVPYERTIKAWKAVD